MRQPAFYVDLSACTGCKTCMVACLDGHDLLPGQPWRRVCEYSGGEWSRLPNNCYVQNVFAYYVPISCNHCQQPVCVQVCPTGVMHKNANGVVCVDYVRYVDSRYCDLNCPYSAPQYSPVLVKMTKCDFCLDQLDSGLNPLCSEPPDHLGFELAFLSHLISLRNQDKGELALKSTASFLNQHILKYSDKVAAVPKNDKCGYYPEHLEFMLAALFNLRIDLQAQC